MFLLRRDLEQAFPRALNPRGEKTPVPPVRKCLRRRVCGHSSSGSYPAPPFLISEATHKMCTHGNWGQHEKWTTICRKIQGWAFHESLLNSDNAWSPRLCLCLQRCRRWKQLFDSMDSNYLEFSDMFILVWNCKNSLGMIFWKAKTMENWHFYINTIPSSQGSNSGLFK